MATEEGPERRLTPEELGAALAWVTARLISDPQLEEFVLRPLRDAGCACRREEILREVVYLVYFGNHIAIAHHSQDAERAGALIGQCAEALAPTLQELELWPAEGQSDLSDEYFQREGEFLDAMVSSETSEGLGAECEAAARVTGRYLFGGVPFDDECVLPLARLLRDQISICARFLDSVRIA